jgi:hypothetical protein
MTPGSRDIIVDRLASDLVGPDAPDERLSDKPTDRYLTGILFPQRLELPPDENERLELSGSEDDEAPPEDLPSASLQRPATMGLSFALTHSGSTAAISAIIRGGAYRFERAATVRTSSSQHEEEAGEQPIQQNLYSWIRRPVEIRVPVECPRPTGDPWIEIEELSGFALHVTTAADDDLMLVTLVLVNRNEWTPEGSTVRPDEMSLFQAELEIMPGPGVTFASRSFSGQPWDDDAAAADLLYRAVKEYATGHTCSATWDLNGRETPEAVRTTWLPVQQVRMVSADGGPMLREAVGAIRPDPLLAATLLDAGDDLPARLEWLPSAYRQWMTDQRSRIKDDADVPPELQEQARRHMQACEDACARIEEGIEYLRDSREGRHAFRLMLRAMEIQRRWAEKGGEPFRWRPFQLAFILHSVESMANPESEKRDTMDLLWFPTGGGKTEAYLGIIAFALFLRRIRRKDLPDRGGGVTCLMRYTLRLLTLQQFERAAALILACEYVRNGHESPDGTPDLSGAAPISVGLWVGSNATPNSMSDARAGLSGVFGKPTPKQLTTCPCCDSLLTWDADEHEPRITVTCSGEACALRQAVAELPVYTVDTLIYNNAPTLVFGTIDKFAQIVRNPDARKLFNRGKAPPPELIIQDELHLISGPLGTIAAVYEIAIDMACTDEGRRPKVIGSTATIRRAAEQIRALFDRDAAQFPPPGLDADDSLFAALPELPLTRRYIGVTTAGRSAKFSLQAVYASLLQSASTLDVSRDGYHTLVGYFNALRELGGAVVLTQDDVPRSLKLISRRRKEERRSVKRVVELTSRVSQQDIRELLDALKRTADMEGAVDIVLATNMISVGVDVSRLSTMVVMGQPKTTAEYIQSTSRVGRAATGGLVVTILNNAKVRDRAYFEAFRGVHSALYRGVEATSVTPFASRSRDRALHAALVGAARLLIEPLHADPSAVPGCSDEIDALIEEITERVRRIDAREADATRRELKRIGRSWDQRSYAVDRYWDDRNRSKSLLISAEKAAGRIGAARGASPWPTLNSMRNVESGTPFRIIEEIGDERAG